MSKSEAKKRLQQLEKEIEHFREEQLRYDRLIENLKSRKQELLARLNPDQVMQDPPQSRLTPEPEKVNGLDRDALENMEKIRELCLRVRTALEKVNRAGGELITRAGLSEEITARTGEKQEAQTDDILEMLNSPKFRKVANELLGELLKG